MPGQGEPLLVLHGGAGPGSTTPILDRYAVTHDVLAPTHPGWAGTWRPDRLDSVGALADLYLDLLADLDLRDVTVLGSSFGGWIAAEMGVRDRAPRLGRLVLVNAAGPYAEGHRSAPGSDAQLEQALPQGARIGLDLLQAYTGPSMQDPSLLPRLAAVAAPVLVVLGRAGPRPVDLLRAGLRRRVPRRAFRGDQRRRAPANDRSAGADPARVRPRGG